MSNLFWLTGEQMARLQPYVPKSHGRPISFFITAGHSDIKDHAAICSFGAGCGDVEGARRDQSLML